MELLPYLEGNDKLYPIVELTSSEQHTKWYNALHTQLDNSTLNQIVDKEYQVDETISITPTCDIKDDLSVNTHTTANSLSLTDEDFESVCATTLQSSPGLFDSDNKICFDWDNMNKLFKATTTKNKTVVNKSDCIAYFESLSFTDLKLDESKMVFTMDQFLLNPPYQDLTPDNTERTDLENMPAQAKVYQEGYQWQLR